MKSYSEFMMKHFWIGIVFFLHTASVVAQSGSEISVPQSLSATIDGTEAIEQNHPADRFVFNAIAGQQVEFQMNSEAFDPYLYILDHDGMIIAEDDDSAGHLDARIRLTFPSTGAYSVITSSFSGGIGAYTLSTFIFEVSPVQYNDFDIGDEIQGSLSENDGQINNGYYADGYTFEGRAGLRLQIEMNTNEFGAALSLIAPTGEIIAHNNVSSGSVASINETLPVGGEYRVLATSNGPNQTGSYTLVAQETTVTSHVIESTQLELGALTMGNLDATDSISLRQVYEEHYHFEGNEGEVVDIQLSSQELDAYVQLLDNNGRVLAENDDADGLNSRLSFPLSSDGTYTVVATSYSMAEGSYVLTVDMREPVEIEAERLRIGQSVNGEFNRESARSNNLQMPIDVYHLELEAGSAIQLRADSHINTYFIVTAPTGESILDQSLGGGYYDEYSNNSGNQIFTAPMSGTYIVSLGSYDIEGGAYILHVEEAGSNEELDVTEIEFDSLVEAEFNGSEPIDNQRYVGYRPYTFTLEEPTTVRITMESIPIDTYLELYQENILLESNDDSNGLNSMIQRTLSSGTYVIHASTYSGGVGPYTLALMELQPVTVAIEPISIGDTIMATLEDSDPQSITRGVFSDVYTFDGQAGQGVTIRMSSEPIDCYLLVFDPNGERVAENDDSNETLNAQVSFIMTLDGDYRVLATSYNGDLGDYQLSLEAGYSSSSLGGSF